MGIQKENTDEYPQSIPQPKSVLLLAKEPNQYRYTGLQQTELEEEGN